MKSNHFAEVTKNKRTKSIVLSIVALLELILLITSITFSWFEGLTSLELHGTNFKTAAALNSHVELGENKSTTDTTYSNIIDLSPYFYDAQKEVRLSPVSSADAENFYAAYDGVPTESNYTSLHYRKLTTEDVNTNIIQFEFNLSSPDGPMDVYFTEVMPVVYINGTARGQEGRYANAYRFAFSDGTTTTIFRTEDYVGSSAANAAPKQIAVSSLNSDDTPITSNNFIRRPHEFTYYSDHRETALSHLAGSNNGVQAPINSILHLSKGETKTITVSVWLEALDYECLNPSSVSPVAGQNLSFSVKLCTSWSISREITIYDYTADQWVDNKGDSNEDTALYVRSTDGKDNNNRQYEFTYNSSEKKWTGTIPIALNNCEFVWGKKGTDKISGTPYATWQAPNRGKSTEITLLGSTACVWDLLPSELTKIDFRDYTTDTWINNKDDKGNDIDISVGITYDGKTLDYSMTSSPTKDSLGKNSWSCWIPSTVNTVNFYRRGYNNDNKYVDFNYWVGNDRDGETVYRAITESDGSTGTDSSYVLYVKIDDAVADTFYANNRGKNPAISYTGTANINLWDSTNNKPSISRYDYHPNQDMWPNGESELTPVPGEDNLWYMAFDQKPADGTHITVWSRSGANNFNDIDSDMSFGVFYLFEAGKNYTTINITTAQKLTSSGASNNYALLGTMDSSGAGVGTGGSSTGTIETGVWGEVTAPSEGSTFIHTSTATSMTVTFTYDGVQLDMEMTSADGKTWTTKAIPDSITSGITFTDNYGNTWTDTGTNTTRSFSNHFFYAITADGTSSTGTGWRGRIYTAGNTSYFKHYDSDITTLTAEYTYEKVPFKVTLTKGSDKLTWNTADIPDQVTTVKYSDGTNSWTMTGKSINSPYCYALSKYKAEFGKANLIRIYFTNNYSWTDIHLHHWGGTTAGTEWPGDTMKSVAKNDQNQEVFVKLIPSDRTGIIFNGKDQGNSDQTSNIEGSSNIADMKAYYLSGNTLGSRVGNQWAIDATFLNTKATNN